MKRAGAWVLLLVLLMMGGCATRAGYDGNGEVDEGTVCYRGHRPPSTIAAVVYVDSKGEVQVVPETIVVEDPNQTVVWTAADGEISDITFAPSECSPGPPSINRKGRQITARFAAGYGGTHKYKFMFHPNDGRRSRSTRSS